MIKVDIIGPCKRVTTMSDSTLTFTLVSPQSAVLLLYIDEQVMPTHINIYLSRADSVKKAFFFSYSFDAYSFR